MTTPPEPPPPLAHPGGIDRGAFLVGLGSLLLIGGFVFALWKIAPAPPPDLGPEAHVLTVPLAVPDFALVDHTGARFDRDRLLGRWSLLFFGYTYCPDICPVTLQSLVPVQALLGEDSDTRIVFVSVDPARDDVDRMAEYVGFFDPAYLGVTGEPEQIAEGVPRAAAESGPHAHAITRWLGVDAPDHTPRTVSLDLDAPGWVLVCSDGLWNYCSEAGDVAALVTATSRSAGSEPLVLAEALVAWANAQGGRDNITVALARIGREMLPAGAPPP